jgi:hypothetical protein
MSLSLAPYLLATDTHSVLVELLLATSGLITRQPAGIGERQDRLCF